MDNLNEKNWNDIFDPCSLSEIVGYKNEIKQIQTWLKNYQTNKKKMLLILGPTGSGKTTIVQKILENLQYNIYKFNILDFLEKKEIKERISKITTTKNIQFMMCPKKIKPIIFIDEIEGINVNTKALIDIIKEFIPKSPSKKKDIKKSKTTNIPVIGIATETYLKKMNDLERKCDIIRFNNPTENNMLNYVRKVLKANNINIKENILKYIINYSNSDFRKLSNILQFIYYLFENNYMKNIKISDLDGIIDKKNVTSNVELFKSSEELFYKNNPTLEDVQIFYDMEKVLLPLMIHQNYTSVLFSKINQNNCMGDIFHTIKKISERYSSNDIINNNIYDNHVWELQKSYAFLCCYYPVHLINSLISRNNAELKNIKRIKIKFTSILSKTSIYHVNFNQYNTICKTIKNYDNYYDHEIMCFVSKKILYYLFSDDNEYHLNGLRLLKYFGLNTNSISKLIKFSCVDTYKEIFTKKLCNSFKKTFDNMDKIE